MSVKAITKKKNNRGASRLPRIRLNLTALLNFAENSKERITMESLVPGTAYVSVAGDGTVILTSNNGYIRINEGDLHTVIEELTEIESQMRLRRAYGCVR